MVWMAGHEFTCTAWVPKAQRTMWRCDPNTQASPPNDGGDGNNDKVDDEQDNDQVDDDDKRPRHISAADFKYPILII